MNRIHTLAPLLGLTALAAALFSAAPTRAQTVTVTDFNSAAYQGVSLNGVSGGTQVGTIGTLDYVAHAGLFSGTAASFVDLHPAGLSASQATGVSGDTQVGYGMKAGDQNHALLWTGTADSVVDLGTGGLNTAEALGVSGDTQVGYGINYNLGYIRALLWHGTAASAVILHPAGFDNSIAYGVSGDTQVGVGYDTIYPYDEYPVDGPPNALLWHGTAASVVNLNASDATYSAAYAVSGDTQVGDEGTLAYNSGVPQTGPTHAYLWHGTAVSGVDLSTSAFLVTSAVSVSGGVEVGYGFNNGGNRHALLWHGTPQSLLDLNAYLPAGYVQATATGVSGSGGVYDVIGNADDATYRSHALLWHIVFPPNVITSLIPASRTEGRSGFPLTVIGTGFVKNSVITWNGAARHTVYISPTQVAASIPASFIATADTAKVAVITPGAGTSNVRTETINPRPVITSISSTTKKSGSSGFTLTVTGTGFFPNSVIKRTIISGSEIPITTTYVSPTKLTTFFSGTTLHNRNSYYITVTTPNVATSNSVIFTVF